MAYLADKDRVFTVLSLSNGEYITVIDQCGRQSMNLKFKHKSVTMNGRTVMVINMKDQVVLFDYNGGNQRTVSMGNR